MDTGLWKIEKSRTLYKSPWLSLREDRCRTEGGLILDPYLVVEHPPWVNAVPVTDDGRIVLVRQYRHGARKFLTGLPAGIVEKGESPLRAAQRELLEETGYSGKKFIPLAKFTASAALHSGWVHSFLALSVEKTRDPSPGPEEELETILMPLEQVWHQLTRGKFCQATHLSALWTAFYHLGMVQKKD